MEEGEEEGDGRNQGWFDEPTVSVNSGLGLPHLEDWRLSLVLSKRRFKSDVNWQMYIFLLRCNSS